MGAVQLHRVHARFLAPQRGGNEIVAQLNNEKEKAFRLEKGDYVLRLGTSSEDTVPVARVRLAADAVTRRVKARLGAEPPRAAAAAQDTLAAVRKAMGLS